VSEVTSGEMQSTGQARQLTGFLGRYWIAFFAVVFGLYYGCHSWRRCYARRLDAASRGDPEHLFHAVPPDARPLILLVWPADYLLNGADPGGLAEHAQPDRAAPVRWERADGLEGGLVGPHGVDVYQRVDLRAGMVVFRNGALRRMRPLPVWG